MPPILITPTPTRPVADGIIETGWGTWAHDLLLKLPRGLVASGTAAGVAFSTLTPDQFSVTFPALTGRLYRLVIQCPWRADVAQTVVNWALTVNAVTISNWRGTNALGAAANSTDHAIIVVDWAAPADIPACSLRLGGARTAGTGTITPGTWSWSVADIGPA